MAKSNSLRSVLPRSITLALQGAVCSLESNHAPFLDFARRYLGSLILDRDSMPAVYARLHWGSQPSETWQGRGVRARGRRLLENDHSLLITELAYLPGLQIEARWTSEAMQIEAYYRPPRALSALAQRVSSDRDQIYNSLVYYLVYFPLFVYLNQSRGLHLLHAGAVAGPDGSTVVAGLPGSGKSTLTLALMSEPGIRLVSDNLLLFDTHGVYTCPEPLHLPKASWELIPEDTQLHLKETGRELSDGRRDYLLAPDDQVQQSRPGSLFLIGLAGRFDILPLPNEAGLERLLAYEHLSREIEIYDQFRASLSLIAPSSRFTARKRGTLKALVSSLDCYEVWLERGGGMQEAAAQVSELARLVVKTAEA